MFRSQEADIRANVALQGTPMLALEQNELRSRHTLSKRSPHSLVRLACAGLVLTAMPALGDADATLEEIIVTASKRETNLMETPLAITAFTQDFLDRQGIHTARDLAGTAPNVQF